MSRARFPTAPVPGIALSSFPMVLEEPTMRSSRHWRDVVKTTSANLL